jgi:hypothetical protein
MRGSPLEVRISTVYTALYIYVTHIWQWLKRPKHAVWLILSRDWVTGFGLVIRFIGLVRLVTTVILIVSLIHRLYSSLHHSLSLLNLQCLHRLSGNGFQRRRPLSFRVHRLLSSLAGVYLTTSSALLCNDSQ